MTPALLQEDQKSRLRLPRKASPAVHAVQRTSWSGEVAGSSDETPPAVIVPRNGEEFVESPPVFKSISRIGTRIAPPPARELIDDRDPDMPEPDDFLPASPAEAYFAQWEPFEYRSEPFGPWTAYSALAVAPSFCHRPLYFEEINVERFGYSAGLLQPAVSAGRFFATVPTLPYRMVVDRPAICQVDPSPYPPGNPAPRHRQLPPLHLRAGLVQAIAIVGMIAIFP